MKNTLRFNNLAKFINDLHLALSFTVLFTAYNTQTHILKQLTLSIQKDHPNYFADGYVCFGIIYTFLASGMWLAPSVLAFIGWKATMIIGAICYIPFVSFCYFENSWLTYLGSAISGAGGALLWTSQANYVVLNSPIGEVNSSISIFWMLFEASYLTGNFFVYYLFNDPTQPIDSSMRAKISLILLVFVLVSVTMIFCLRKPIRQEEKTKKLDNPLGEIKKGFQIFTSKKMLLYSVIFLLAGTNLTFMSIAAASLGFSTYLSTNSKKYAPLSGVMQGIGEIIGCSLSLFIKRISKSQVNLIPLACLTYSIGYSIYFIGLTNNSVFAYSDELPLIQLPIFYFMVANVLIGIGDACLHIEIYNYVGKLYPNDSAPAFAIFKFTRCLAAAISSYYGNYLGLYLQLGILFVLAFGSVLVYYVLKENTEGSREQNEKELHIKQSPNQYYQGGTDA